VNAIGFDCKGDVGAGVDEQSSSQFSVLSSQLLEEAYGFAGEGF